VLGVAIVWTGSAVGRTFARAVEPIGTLWVNALRMTVVPLVVSLLVSTLASSTGLSTFNRLGRRALAIFVIILSAIAVLGTAMAIPMYSRLHVDPAAAASLRATAAANMPTAAAPSIASWVVGLIPTNVVKAAADGAMLPLIVFAVALGLALGQLDAERREPLVNVFRAIASAMMVLVHWVLLFAPIGAFALAVTIATRLGNATAEVILFYLLSQVIVLTVIGALMYVIVPMLARIPISRFARAMLPADVVVVTTRSSLAALPAMIDTAERMLKLPTTVVSFGLPFGVSLLRASTAVSWVVSALFLGKLYGVPLALPQLLGLAAASVAMSFAVPGIPSGGYLIAAPYFLAVGLPVQGIGILIALDAIPDIFKTLVNVTAHMAATLLLVPPGTTAVDVSLPAAAQVSDAETILRQ
jgi:Na+/H+-dicarboxylate symporter